MPTPLFSEKVEIFWYSTSFSCFFVFLVCELIYVVFVTSSSGQKDFIVSLFEGDKGELKIKKEFGRLVVTISSRPTGFWYTKVNGAAIKWNDWRGYLSNKPLDDFVHYVNDSMHKQIGCKSRLLARRRTSRYSAPGRRWWKCRLLTRSVGDYCRHDKALHGWQGIGRWPDRAERC